MNAVVQMNEGHRERLRERFLQNGDTALADHELLELILFYAIPRRDTKSIAKELLKQLDRLIEMRPALEAAIKELGE